MSHLVLGCSAQIPDDEPIHDVWSEESNGVDYQLEHYKGLFDENGKFKVDRLGNNLEMPKDEFEVHEQTKSIEENIKEGEGEDEEEEEIVYNHIRTPLYTVRLTSSYEVKYSV